MDIAQIATRAKKAAIELAAVPADIKNKALGAVAKSLDLNRSAIVEANTIDMQHAEQARLAAPLLKRLRFDQAKIDEACAGLESLIRLEDPVGQTISALELDQGLELFKVSCPIGVIGVIFESRPDALVQISSLCLKSGNGVLLKGGSEAARTNRILADLISDAAVAAGVPEGWLGLMETRDDVADMLAMDGSIDLIIPRGSNAFVKHIMDNTHIPVLGHADGICHIYLDKQIDDDMAVRIAVDSKIQYVAVCNAAETLLIHQEVAERVLPLLKSALEAKQVEIRGCDQTRQVIDVLAADEADWQTEYLDYIISIKVVPSMSAALKHINTYGSGHTDVIVTRDKT
ncbi:MAG: glutamate-5-semialdehyde dehydrogenase, partial [Desulfobacteraceae bacterium]